jgi:hypothetical protein
MRSAGFDYVDVLTQYGLAFAVLGAFTATSMNTHSNKIYSTLATYETVMG